MTVEVVAGKSDCKKNFHVHMNVLSLRSEFFKEKVLEIRTEGRLRRITLENVTPKAFEVYAKWLYTGAIDISTLYLDSASLDQSRLSWCATLYVVSQTLRDYAFQDRMIDLIVAVSRDAWRITHKHLLPNGFTIGLAYAHTPTKSPLRRIFVDMHADKGNGMMLSEMCFVDQSSMALFFQDPSIALLAKLTVTGVAVENNELNFGVRRRTIWRDVEWEEHTDHREVMEGNQATV
jgi:hypothetical protein